jgi:hypothetical protein
MAPTCSTQTGSLWTIATNRRGEHPVERPLTPKDLLATVYRHLGIDDRAEFRDLSCRGRNLRRS